MSQASVSDEPVQTYEGKVDVSGQYPTNYISRIASESIYFGKAVSPVGTDELEVGGASGGPQEVKMPSSAALIALITQGGGVAIADPSKERLKNNGVYVDYGVYLHEDSVTVMRKGRIWVVVEAELTDLSSGVYIRFQNAGATPPAASLGSFTPTNTADHSEAPAGFAWLGAATIGSVNFGLLELNLPG